MIKLFLKFSTKIFGKKINLAIVKFLSNFSRKFAYKMHEIQFKYEWGTAPTPQWFDHFCDQFYLFRQSKNPLWVERGILNLLVIKDGSEILELCCGDGYYTNHFYSIRAKKIVSVDFDSTAIKNAIKNNKAENIEFKLCDIRSEIPQGAYDNILWDAGIAYFTEDEIRLIMGTIKNRLKCNGILSGYTIIERADGKSLKEHKYEFKSKDDLKRFLEPYFKNIKLFETTYPSRHNLYFWASDGILPYDKDWESLI